MIITRRQLLTGTAGVLALTSCSSTSGPARTSSARSPTAPVRHSYGGNPSQFGELSRPEGRPKAGTVVIIHGGFWRAQYDLSLGRPLAADLVKRGYVTWNLEYRRVGNGGGWTGTFDDVAAGIDKLAHLGVDTTHVVAIGHSAGGQLAVWAGARPKLPVGTPGAQPKVKVTAAVSQAGVLDLATAARTGVGGTAEADLLGGSPDEVPYRYRLTDPIELLPILTPVLCVHSRADANVPFAQSTAYVAAAKTLGSEATLKAVDGDHFTLIDPSSKAWTVVLDALPRLLSN
ncbi:MAG: S9 family peptidase [Actinomycetota bacterium]|nr:S9 family peptidase [Actinomycetota bacterium]